MAPPLVTIPTWFFLFLIQKTFMEPLLYARHIAMVAMTHIHFSPTPTFPGRQNLQWFTFAFPIELWVRRGDTFSIPRSGFSPSNSLILLFF